MKKKDIIEGKIIKTEFPNKGTFICEDQKVTVKGVINGQRIKGQVTKKRKSGCVVRLLDVLEKSPLEDAKPVCPHFGICGGCFYQTVSYENQLKIKEGMVRDLLKDHVNDDIWEETGVITEQGSKELGAYEMGDAFDFPKPTYLIKKALTIGASKDSLCVDFFSGSATTVEAVMSLNAADKGTRRIIAVQLPENLDLKLENTPKTEKTKVQKVLDFLDSVHRPHALDQVGLERISRAVKHIREQYPDTTADLGFRHFTLKEPTSMSVEKMEKFSPDENGLVITNTVLEEFGIPTILATWLVRDGYGFTAPVETVDFAGYIGYYMGKHLYLINQKLSNEAIAAITEKFDTDGTFNPDVVLFGYSFKWTEMEALKTNLARLKDTEKNLRINFDIRY